MKNKTLWTNTGIVVDDNRVIFVPFMFDMLVEYDCSKRKVVRSVAFNESDCMIAAAYNVEKYKDEIVVIPARDSRIQIINRNGELKKIYALAKNCSIEKYSCAVNMNGIIYIFPLDENGVIKISEEGFSKIDFGVNQITSTAKYGRFLAAVNNSNIIWILNPLKQSVEKFAVQEDIQACWIGTMGEDIVILSRDGRVILFAEGLKSDGTELFRAPLNDFFSSAVIFENKMILFLHDDPSKIFMYNFIDKVVSVTHISYNADQDDWNYNSFGQPVFCNEKVYVMSPKHQQLMIINKEGNVEERHDIRTDENRQFLDFGKVCEREFQRSLKKEAILEDNVFTLNEFIDYVRK